MSTATPPPLPRQPLGKTFLVSVCILGLFAVFQLFAIVWHYLPLVHQQLTASVNARSEEPAATPEPTALPRTPVSAPQDAEAAADAQRVQGMLDQTDHALHIGDYDGALKILAQAEEIVPGDPGVLMRKAEALEQNNQPEDAITALQDALRYPGLPEATRTKIQRKLDMLSRSVAANPAADDGSGVPVPMADDGSQELRENGLQPGANLGIIDVRFVDSSPGIKSLHVGIKSRPGTTIDVKDVKIQIYFYEQTDDGDVVPTDSKVNYQWLSPPIDWANNEPELLEVQYSPPADASSGRKYFGYVIGIYYDGELQDLRADPGKLAQDFSLPLHLKQ